jgi:hypothetical protein
LVDFVAWLLLAAPEPLSTWTAHLRPYRHEPWRLALSVMCYLATIGLSALEAYVLLHFLNVPVPFLTAVIIEACGSGTRFVTFVFPASLGTLEGGDMMTFAALGFGGRSRARIQLGSPCS